MLILRENKALVVYVISELFVESSRVGKNSKIFLKILTLELLMLKCCLGFYSH